MDYKEKYGRVFTPGKIGNVELPHRIIMTVMHTGMSLEAEGDFLAERAKHGAALVTASIGVHECAANDDMHVINEANAPGIKSIADKVHAAGGKFAVQMFHAGRNLYADRIIDKSAKPLAPSEVPSPIYRSMPKAMTAQDIEDAYAYYKKAALILKSAGTDVIEISASAGYLLSEFFSTRTNLREDEYGGSLENRMRFPLGVLKSVREAVGPDQAVTVRISASDMLGGYSVSDMQKFAAAAQEYVDAINVTGGWHEARIPQISMHLPPGGYAFLAGEIKQAVSVPVIACNRVNDPAVAEEILAEGLADFVGCAREFLIEPEFIERVKAGVPYKKCIGCNKGCIENVLKCVPATCVFNPVAGFEKQFEADLKAIAENDLGANGCEESCGADADLSHSNPGGGFYAGQKVLIAGAGPSGLNAAKYLALAGVDVTLCAKDARFGGHMKYAGMAPHKSAILHNIETMAYDAEKAGAKLMLNTEVTPELIEEMKPARVLLCSGTSEIVPPIPGIDMPHVTTLKKVFDSSDEELEEILSKNACIIGGGASGIELAHWMLEKQELLKAGTEFLDIYDLPETAGHFKTAGRLSIIEMLPKIGADLGSSRWITMKELGRYPLNMIASARATGIREGFVDVEVTEKPPKDAPLNADGTAPEPKVTKMSIPADIVILASGFRPANRELMAWLDEKGIKYDRLGDCSEGRRPSILEATKDAFRIID